TGTAKFDRSVYLTDGPSGLKGYLEYNADLFEPATAARLVGHWQTLLAAVAADPDQPVSTLPLLTPAERQLLLVDRNATQVPLPPERCVHELVEGQVRRTPEALALVS